MKKLTCLILSAFLLGLHCAAADTNPPPRLTVELRDGSRVVGDSVEKNFEFHSALLGKIKLDVKNIRAVECVSSNSAKLSTVNGDSLTVSFVDSEFAVKTSFGKVELQVDSVRKLSVSPGSTGAQPPGLVALWSGEGDGVDSVGGNTAILTDITFADGQVGRAFSFNGTSSSLRIPASPALDIGAGESFTITAWIKPSDVNGYHPLFAWSDGNPVNASICFNSSQSGALMVCLTDGEGNRFLVSHQGVLASGSFQHIALTYDKTTGIGTWYLNGGVVAQRQLGGQLNRTKGDLWFSRRDTTQGNWSSNRSFAGLLDELALYNRTLSADEIHALCTEQSHGEPLATPAVSTGWYESWMR
jgi:hypothetical protein